MSILRRLPLIVLGSIMAFAQTSVGKPTVYLDQENPFTPDFTAALTAKSVPVIVTTDPANARYSVTFTLNQNNSSVFREKAGKKQEGKSRTRKKQDRRKVTLKQIHLCA